jgi:hypothetical protein
MPKFVRTRIVLSKAAIALLASLLAIPTWAQSAAGPENLRDLLSFESAAEQDLVQRWNGIRQGIAQLDNEIVHDGQRSVRIARDPGSVGTFSALTIGLPVSFGGRKIELCGWLRTQDVTGFGGLWLRTSHGATMLALDNMSSRNLNGTHDWAEFSVALPLSAEADRVTFGALLSGTGKLWADTLQLLVDGQPVWDIPAGGKPQALTASAEDFGASGSGVRVTRLSPVQIQGLHLLGRVWGFLKYHHPRVTSGKVPWDAELFRVLPRVLDAHDSAEVETRIVDWIDSLGAVSPCSPCAQLSQSRLQLAPRLEWLDDRNVAGEELRLRLRTILANRAPDQQFYVSLKPNVGNPSFDNEPDYARAPLPDAGFQLLGLFRFWSAVEYWYPYRSLIDADWTAALREFIPRIAEAATRDDYQLQLLALIAKVGDSHANLWSSLQVRPPLGACQLPVNVRFIEGLPVVTGYSGTPGLLRLGDVLERLDGAVLSEQIERWRPYYAGSNDGSRLRDIGRFMTRGECGPTTALAKREDRELELQTERVPVSTLNIRSADSNELEGPSFRMLSPSVAYLKVSNAKADEITTHIQAARNAQGIVVDLRGYPSEFLVFKLGGHFVAKETVFARFAIPDLSNPGAFNWMESISLQPVQPHYDGKVLVLVDETTQSQAEYTVMALRAAPRSTIVGSATAGADGNVSRLPLPGGMWSLISGIGVYYPDKRPTQRVGIQPDVPARPTVSGIRGGQDDVLAVALGQVISGPGAKKKIADLAKRSNGEWARY